MADPWDPTFGVVDDFLDFDDDNLTADALHRVAQLEALAAVTTLRQTTTVPEAMSLRECKLFLAVHSVDGIPLDVGCFANCHKTFYCEVEVSKTVASFPLVCCLEGSPTGGIESSFVASRGPDRVIPSWDLAEYYGETRIQLRLKTRKMFRDVTVGTRTIRLSELLAKQQENSTQELKQGTWCMRHQIKVHTTIKNNKKVTRSPATPSLWLQTAKSAHNSLAAASSTATGLNITAEKQKLSGNGPFEPSQSRRGTHHYASVPAESNTTRKGTDVTVHVEFRLVQLQSCLQTSLLTVRDPTIEIGTSGGNSPRRGRRAGADSSPPVTPTSRTAPPSVQPAAVSQQLACIGTAASTASTVKEYAQMSELQFLAVTAPSGMVVEVMRALARQDALLAAMELRHVITADPTVASIAASSVGAASNAATGVGAVSGVNAGTRPRRSLGTAAGSSGGPAPADNPSGLTAFELALLHRQEATVLEMLQRCGGLCFNNITVGRGSPLHAAVRGGSAMCVEYVGRYLRKYGARRVTGPGARLWMSSLQAKLEWRDAQDDTALAVACRSAPAGSAHAIAIYLLILGADAAAVNTLTNYTPLMYACQHGPTELVSTLLSIQKSPQDILDGILNVGDVNSILNNATMLDVEPAVREELQSAIATAAQTARSSALANHLYSNSRSSNILRGRNPAEGGYFNPLSTYTCDPTRRESSLGRNALHLAVQRGEGAIVQLLLNIGMSCAEVDYRGDNCLHIAARRGDKGIITLLADAERTEWTAHRELIKQGKSMEVMRHRAQALLKRNCVGDTPVDVALEEKHFAAVGELLRGAIKAYGTVPLALAQSYYDRLQISASTLPLSPVAGVNTIGGSTPGLTSEQRHHALCVSTLTDILEKGSPAPASLSSGPATSPSSPPRPPPSALAVGALVLTLVDATRSEECKDSRSDSPEAKETSSEDSAVAVGLYDNVADSVEYMLALSPLGLKYINDTAGRGAISYLPSDGGSGGNERAESAAAEGE